MTLNIPQVGMEALGILSMSEPTSFLTPSETLAAAARTAASSIFRLQNTSLSGKPQVKGLKLSELYTDGFDPEQIWLQMDMQTAPVLSFVKRHVSRASKKIMNSASTPSDVFPIPEEIDEVAAGEQGGGVEEDEHGDEEFDDLEEDSRSRSRDEDDEEEVGEEVSKVDRKKMKTGALSFEDDFLRVEDMERFLEEAEAAEQNSDDEGAMAELYQTGDVMEDDEDEEENEEDEDDEEDGGRLKKGAGSSKNLFKMGSKEMDDEEAEEAIKYDDFFGASVEPKKSRRQTGKRWEEDENEEAEVGGADEDDYAGAEEEDEGEEEEEVEAMDGKPDLRQLSSHERRQQKIREQAEDLERANLNPKSWTMRGEVSSSHRPKNSALEVDIEFEHASRPPPIITQEVTESLEDIIRKRVLEQRFDDVERKKPPANATPKERSELDDAKSQQGLADIYEAEYSAAAGLTPAATATSDVLKSQAALLFKELCGKLDALSHFQFAPKPVIEDMSVKADVPAIAMEEVAPIAVSVASLLAPEEVFAGGGDNSGGAKGSAAGAVKSEGELTKEDRRQKHRKLKRKRRAELQGKLASSGKPDEVQISAKQKKAKIDSEALNTGKEQVKYTKSSQVFAKMEETRHEVNKRKKDEPSLPKKSSVSFKL